MTLTFSKGKFCLQGFPLGLVFTDQIENKEVWFSIKFGFALETSSVLAAAQFRPYASDAAERIFNRALMKLNKVPLLPPLPFLDSHQREGVKWILTRSRSYLAHAPGAGKTCEAVVASVLSKGEGKVLFIVPPSLTKNWEVETLNWTEFAGLWPAIATVPVTAQRQDMAWDAADFIICPDSMLDKPWVIDRLFSTKWKFIGVDEASRYKEEVAARTKVLFGGVMKNGFESTGLIYESPRVVLLDGSPMPNRPIELWAPVFAMAPETIDFMSKHDFGFKFCGAQLNDWGGWEYRGASNEDELRRRLREKFMHVVTEEELNHPERLRKMLFINGKDPRTALHKSWERRHLQQMSFNDLSEDMSQGDIARFRRELGLKKVPWAIKYINERLKDPDEKILLFAWHRDVLEAVYEGLRGNSMALIMGGTRASYREAAFRDFNEGASQLIAGNIGAMGRGHNLQAARRVVFLEYSWTDELNKQCEKRASRKGSKHRSIPCEYIVAPGTMDEKILNAVFTKQRTVKRIIG